MVSKLYLDLVSRKLDGIVLSDGMCRVQNGLFGLLENYQKTIIFNFFLKMYSFNCSTHCLGMNYYVNFLEGIGSNGFHIRLIFGTPGN